MLIHDLFQKYPNVRGATVSAKDAKPYKLAIVVFFVSLVLAILLPKIIVLLIGILAIALLLSYRMRIDLLFSSALSVALSIIFFGLVMSLFASFNKDALLFQTFSVIFDGVTAALISYIVVVKGYKSIPIRSRSSLIGAGVALAFFVFLCLPLGPKSDIATYVHFLASGEDNISHFSIFNYILTNKHLAYFHESGVWRGLANYPQTIHAFFAYISDSLDAVIDMQLNRQLRLYFYSEAFLTALAAFFFVRTIFAMIQKKTLEIYAIFGIVVFLLLFLVLSPLIVSGYYVQLACLMFIGATASLLHHYGDSKDKIVYAYIIACLGLIGSLLTWYEGAILFAALLMYYLFRYPKKLFRTTLLLAPIVLLSLVPSILHLFVGNSAEAIMENSSATVNIPVILILLMAVVFIAIAKPRKNALANNPLIFFIFSAGLATLIFCGALLAVNGSVNYFFFKLLILIVPLYLLAAFWVFQNNSGVALRATIYIIVLTLGIGYYASIESKYITNYSTSSLSMATYPEIKEIEPILNSPNGSPDTLYLNQCKPFMEYFLNRWIAAILLTSDDDRRDIELKFYNNKSVLDTISQYQQTHPGAKTFATGACELKEE